MPWECLVQRLCSNEAKMSNLYSPNLGLFTAVFEGGAAFWVFRSRLQRMYLYPIVAILLLLGIYQVLEVLICWRITEPSILLSRLAFLDITWLPSFGLMLVARMITPHNRALDYYVRGSFVLAGCMSFWIIIDYRFVTGTICAFMYAKYLNVMPHFHLYGAFYEASQFSMIFIPAYFMIQSSDLITRQQLGDLLFGALLYILPSLFLAAVSSEALTDAHPSVMCHFALFYAFFLVRIVRRASGCSSNLASEVGDKSV